MIMYSCDKICLSCDH